MGIVPFLFWRLVGVLVIERRMYSFINAIYCFTIPADRSILQVPPCKGASSRAANFSFIFQSISQAVSLPSYGLEMESS